MYFGLVGVLEFMGLKVGEASLSSCFAPPTQAQVRHINFLLLPHTRTLTSHFHGLPIPPLANRQRRPSKRGSTSHPSPSLIIVTSHDYGKTGRRVSSPFHCPRHSHHGQTWTTRAPAPNASLGAASTLSSLVIPTSQPPLALLLCLPDWAHGLHCTRLHSTITSCLSRLVLLRKKEN